MSATGPATARPRLFSPVTLGQLRLYSKRQWALVAVVAVAAFVAIGSVGETLPWSSAGRVFAVQWWNWATLIASSVLLGLIAATFVTAGSRGGATRGAGSATGSGLAGTVAAIAMACPVCSPLAIPLLGVGGTFAFLRGDRGWLALASVLILGLTLLLRLRASTGCSVRPWRARLQR